MADKIVSVKDDCSMAPPTVLSGATSTASPASFALRAAAAVRPQDPAIAVDKVTVGFAELNSQVDCLAQRLVEGGGDGDRIALRANGTHASVVAFLAIARAGMVSVPIDPTAPGERVRATLADVEAALLLTDVDGDQNLAVASGHPLTLGADRFPLPVDRDRGELVSIVYTSGSVGAPKGIMIGREQMDQTFVPGPDAENAPGARLGVIFAGTTGNIERLVAAALFRQGTLVSYEIRRHGIVPLGRWLERERIVAVALVPTVLRHLLSALAPEQRFPDLRTVVLSGETCTWEDVTRLRAHLSPDATIVNAFGLTEAAGIASLHITRDVLAGEGPLPAGELSVTSKVTIVGDDGAPVAQGERGEIVVEGPDCALGYWRRPDLTRSVFTKMPSGHRRVRTGDSGRIRDDGMLEHLGRLDYVVKISGNRVELGEVEGALAKIDGVAAAAVATYVDDTLNTRLTACVIPRRGAELDRGVLRALLARRLPGYMLPDQIVVVDELPQLAGGKLDRAGVAALRGTEPARPADHAGGRSELEDLLAEIWCDVLRMKAVETDADFFALGGDSMRAARVFVELERRHGIDRPMSLLLEAPTIATLALALSDTANWSALLPVQTGGSRPPLFVLHDGAGSVAFSRSLAGELGPEQPIYGVSCEGLDGTPLRANSLEDLAATYIERVRELQRHGPYVFYGVSHGGTIAMEMARQLKGANERVALVMLGDTWAPVGPRLSTRELGAARLRELRQMSGRSRLRHFGLVAKRQLAYRATLLGREARAERQQERMVSRALERAETVPTVARRMHVMREIRGLVDEYRPRPPFANRVVLLRAEGTLDRADRGWSELVGDALEIIDVPGRHGDLCREASSAYAGPVLARALNDYVGTGGFTA
jgi:acyl-coenzyme A synthetase/AMP-(fatty) acid ligase/thioesterase domain-containing protein/acyl carrier protein